jgi:hypothetical protein
MDRYQGSDAVFNEGISRARERSAGKDATDQLNIALSHPERVADVAKAVSVDVTQLGMGEGRLAA